ncbi:cytochrome o ubiquinol oxidase subunit IV [bacterium]|nr:cytochrome o ubiquinol oxidase subunit IV [bacterium]
MHQDHRFEQALRQYIIGFVLALALTGVPFALVAWGKLPGAVTLLFVLICGLTQMVVQFRYFLHIDFTQQKREDLLLILFSTLLLAIMAGGTIWIMSNLAHRMH